MKLDTACPLDCPDSCSLQVTVEEGRVAQIEGGYGNPLTQGFICSKVRRFPQHLYSAERIAVPAIRTGAKGADRFSPISWGEAFDRLEHNIREIAKRYGGEAILPLSYGGSNGAVTHQAADRRFFFRLGASRLARTVCAAPSTAAATGLYGKMAGVSPTDYDRSRLIVVWGANPSASGIHFAAAIQNAKRRGAKLVVVDPRRIPLARQADLHLAPRPGTDLPVALSLVRWFFETGRADWTFLNQWADGVGELREKARPWTFQRAAETAGLEASSLETLARLYAESAPAVIRCGWGLERNRNGGSAVAAVLALPAVAGKFGVRGGGYTLSNAGAFDLNSDEVLKASEPATRVVNMNRVGRELLAADPPIRLLFVYNCNPLATLPNQAKVRQGLQREDLYTVVFDQVMTDTARYADLLLPATTFLEHHDLARGYGAMLLHPVNPVIAPVGEARSNFEVFTELEKRLDLSQPDDCCDAAEFRDRLLDATDTTHPEGNGAAHYPPTGFAPVQFVDALPKTHDRKIHLFPPELDREAPLGLYSFQPDPGSRLYPLALLSPATNRTISSSLGQLVTSQARLEIHPEDARERAIENGDLVRVFNQLGEVVCRALHSEDLRPGTVLLPKGLWCRHTSNGNTANTLAPDSLTDLGAGACFNDARVQVQKARGTGIPARDSAAGG